MRIRPQRRPPRRRQRFPLGGGGAEKQNLEFYKKSEKRINRKKHRKDRQKSLKTSILEELRKNGCRHQNLRKKLPVWTFFQIRRIESWRKYNSDWLQTIIHDCKRILRLCHFIFVWGYHKASEYTVLLKILFVLTAVSSFLSCQ